jgi:hypothetical protein
MAPEFGEDASALEAWSKYIGLALLFNLLFDLSMKIVYIESI